MPQVQCTECTWSGDSDDTLNDVYEDADGDMVGEHSLACPDCHAPTSDVYAFDADDVSDSYGG